MQVSLLGVKLPDTVEPTEIEPAILPILASREMRVREAFAFVATTVPLALLISPQTYQVSHHPFVEYACPYSRELFAPGLLLG